MKKIVLFFAAVVLCGLTIKAQPNKNHDVADGDLTSSPITNHDTWNSNSPKLKVAAVYQKLDSAVRPTMSKDYYVYDNNKRTIQQVSFVWQNQHWVNSAKEDDIIYDSNGNLSSMIGYTWNASLSQWINDTKSELTYNNNLISSALISDWKNNQWRNSFKSEYSYNSNSNNTSVISSTWDTIALQWENTLKNEYEYDNLNRRILSTNWIWDNNDWSNTSKTDYSYDTNGNIVLQNNYAWDISTGTWLLSSKDEFTYDTDNRRISALHSLSLGGVIWMNATKTDYTYPYTVSPNNLILPYSAVSYYNQSTNITAASYTTYTWNMITSNWDISYTMNKYFSDFDVNAPALTVSTNAINIGSAAGSTNTFDITSNLNWTAASNQSWLTLSNETGTGNKTITLTATANPGSTSRTATVTVSAAGVPSQTIIVTQAVPGILVTALLEGAYAGAGLMKTALKTGALVPLSQPYNVAPWNYAGTETVTSVPSDVVDWILIELRQAATPAEALPGTVLPGWPKACFLKSNGSVVDLDGISSPALGNPAITGNLYVIIRHRNHIAVMSAAGMTLTGSNYVYNFTDAISKAHGGSAGYRQIEPGVFGMVSGDTDGDGEVSVLDFSKWATDFGKTTIYLSSDIDTDGEVSVLDFSKWATNFGVGNIPPLKKLSLEGSGHKYRSQVPGLN